MDTRRVVRLSLLKQLLLILIGPLSHVVLGIFTWLINQRTLSIISCWMGFINLLPIRDHDGQRALLLLVKLRNDERTGLHYFCIFILVVSMIPLLSINTC